MKPFLLLPLAAALPFLLPQDQPKGKAASRYRNAELGFTLDPPAFPPPAAGTQAMVVNFLAPAQGSFSPNINVLVQEQKRAREEYAATTRGELERIGLAVQSVTELEVGGQPALMFEYSGPMQGRELHCLALAVLAPGRVYVVTCTATKDQFPKHEAAFRASLKTFALDS